MDASDVKRNLGDVPREGEKRERAPAKGWMVSDKPMKPGDVAGKRERAPGKEAKDPDIPTQFSDSTRGGGNEDTLVSGEGKREQASVEGAKCSDEPSASLGEDATDTPGTLAGNREREPADGVMDSGTPAQSIDEKSRLGDPHLAFGMDKEVVREHALW